MSLIYTVCHGSACAKEWIVSPSLVTGETVTDNLNLSAKNKKSAFITEISPGLVVRRHTKNVNLDLKYKLQSLFNASDGENKIFHQLDTNARFQIVENSLFFNARASNNQQNINNNFISNNNISNINNRTNVTSYGFSPQWTPHFNGYAIGDIRFNYDELSFGSTAASSATRMEEIINLSSDKKTAKNLLWRFAYANRSEIRQNGNDINFQNTEAEMRLFTAKHLNFFAIVGESDNSYQTQSNSYNNGAYYTIGAQWQPSQKFSLEAGYGTNSHVTLNISPLRNMTWATTFRNRGVGLNTGNTWQTDLKYTTNRSTIYANYLEDTTSSQGTLFDQAYGAQNIFQQTRFSQNDNQINNTLPSLSNEAYIRKRANIGWDYQMGRSLFSTRLYNERRIFQTSNLKEEVSGVFTSWNWQVANSMRLFISPLWQHTSRSNSDDVRKDIAIGLSRVIPIKFDSVDSMNAMVEYRHSNQTSNLIDNNFDENRLTANLLLSF